MGWQRKITAIDPVVNHVASAPCSGAVALTLAAFSTVPSSWIHVRGVGFDTVQNIMGISPILTITAASNPDHYGFYSGTPSGETDDLLPWCSDHWFLQIVQMDQPATWMLSGLFVYYTDPATMGLVAR